VIEVVGVEVVEVVIEEEDEVDLEDVVVDEEVVRVIEVVSAVEVVVVVEVHHEVSPLSPYFTSHIHH
jgi:hypothetical protein